MELFHILENFHVLDFYMNFYTFFMLGLPYPENFTYPGKFPYRVIFSYPVKASILKLCREKEMAPGTSRIWGLLGRMRSRP